ncbi:PREDICTED: probable G-protein coupled receptor B0563.6 [Priapulus caudatus]|uniref:Probable G-protein coupled receptor B0563.6 n=1 Tax=Priapulus caudatus TaxID=37621 RepID=A0ABM1EIK7_PRICU|nr:PREDICTED: probable G-protein coupled receptor B0563.6 [Priapulus caudatus]
MNASSSSPTFDDVDIEDYNKAVISISVVEPLVCVLGMFGNALGLLALSSRQLKGPSYVFLRSLMVVDFTVLLIILVTDTMWHLQLPTYAYSFFYAHVEQPAFNAFMSTSNYLTVALSIERFMAVCRPVRYSAAKQAVFQAKIFIVVVFAISALVSAPYGLEYVVVVVGAGNDTNATADVRYDLRANELLRSGAYATWWTAYVWLQSALSRIVPFFLLLGLNGSTFYAFHKKMRWRDAWNRQTEMTSSDKKRMKVTDTKNRRLMGLLVCTVAVFFVCMTPALVMMFITKETNRWLLTIKLTNLLEVISFAANFYVYCLASRFFRDSLVAAFLCRKEATTASAYTAAAPSGTQNIQLLETKQTVNNASTCQTNGQ